jgi:hypothetical protein
VPPKLIKKNVFLNEFQPYSNFPRPSHPVAAWLTHFSAFCRRCTSLMLSFIPGSAWERRYRDAIGRVGQQSSTMIICRGLGVLARPSRRADQEMATPTNRQHIPLTRFVVGQPRSSTPFVGRSDWPHKTDVVDRLVCANLGHSHLLLGYTGRLARRRICARESGQQIADLLSL